MSLIQFWRILWARHWLIVGTMACCLAGALVVMVVVPARWQAGAHVLLNLLKPDPVTGEIISGPSSRSYVETQIELITDYSVVGPAVDKLGWLSDPDLIQQYQDRGDADTRDFRHWLSQLIIDRTKADVTDGSNILSIDYTGSTPESAQAVANALMQSYLETSVAFRRADAVRNEEWYNLQAKKAKSDLQAAETAEATFERENGVVMQDDKTDVDSARLAAMAVQGSSSVNSAAAGDSQLAEVEAELNNAEATLGPNHPDLLRLRARRDALAALAAKDRGAANSAGASGIDAQKTLVISRRDKLAKLKTLQTEVDVLSDLYSKTVQKEADFRQQAAVTDAGLTPLGNATVPKSPIFPNKPLIIGGSLALGIILGALVALLAELLNRRVRGAEDLQSSLNVPLLVVLRSAV